MMPRRPGCSLLDLWRGAAKALLARRTRTVLAALGVSVGVAAFVAVTTLAYSSRADVIRTLDDLGTNVLTAAADGGATGQTTELVRDASRMAERIGPVRAAAGLRTTRATVRRTDRVPAVETRGIQVVATDLAFFDIARAELASGRLLDEATAHGPAVVLGSSAAERLGVEDLAQPARVWLGEQWWTVVGVLEPMPLATELDTAAFVGFPAMEQALDEEPLADQVRTTVAPDAVEDVPRALAATVNPERPADVQVSRPTEALEARAVAIDGNTRLLLALSGVAVLVAGMGIANVLVVSVMERRREIGIRLALGATPGDVRQQFLFESALLGLAGAALGLGVGVAVAGGYAFAEGWELLMPWWVPAGAVAGAVTVGVLAGLGPASRAARLPPVRALRTD